MVSGFFNQVEEAIGIKLSEPASSEQYLSSLIATGAQEGGRSYFVLLLASLIEPFSELESLDLLLPSEFGVSMTFLPDVYSLVSSLPEIPDYMAC